MARVPRTSPAVLVSSVLAISCILVSGLPAHLLRADAASGVPIASAAAVCGAPGATRDCRIVAASSLNPPQADYAAALLPPALAVPLVAAVAAPLSYSRASRASYALRARQVGPARTGGIPEGVSICGPFGDARTVPPCQVGGTTISLRQHPLSAYAVTVRPPGSRLPNLGRYLTISQVQAAGLLRVLASTRLDGVLAGTQVIPLDQLQSLPRSDIRIGNTYSVEVDYRSPGLDNRWLPIGTAGFTLLP